MQTTTSCRDKKLFLLELNEINFDIVQTYLSRKPGKFKALEKLMALPATTTEAEEHYENLEPWIQWVSAHTGLTYSEHKVFRLGDMVNCSASQIYEEVESKGFRVGAISPMNTVNRLKKPAYFIPDPWTQTATDGSLWSKKLSEAIKQTVNDNSQAKITPQSALWLLMGLLRFARFKNYKLYLKLALRSKGFPWRKALFLDLFLSDLHLKKLNKENPNFSSLFLNGGAHIQHHYFFNSPHVDTKGGAASNPDWYVPASIDPFEEMLEIYDVIVQDHLQQKKYSSITATGLSQVPYTKTKFYYRLKNHADFLSKIGVNFKQIHPRMTRDFLVEFQSEHDAINAERSLKSAIVDGEDQFLFGEIDNRGKDLFVTLTYPHEITTQTVVKVNGNEIPLHEHVVFVAIKNGMHQSKGFAYYSESIKNTSLKNQRHVKNIAVAIRDFFDTPSIQQ